MIFSGVARVGWGNSPLAPRRGAPKSGLTKVRVRVRFIGLELVGLRNLRVIKKVKSDTHQ